MEKYIGGNNDVCVLGWGNFNENEVWGFFGAAALREGRLCVSYRDGWI